MAPEQRERRYVLITVDLVSADEINAVLIRFITFTISICADAAAKVWNSHLGAVRRLHEESVLDLQAEAAIAVDATVDHLCR